MNRLRQGHHLHHHYIRYPVTVRERIYAIFRMHNGSVDSEYRIELPYPRRENDGFHHDVMRIRKQFFR